MLMQPRIRRASKPQRGLSLVELMVGIAVGMFIVAAASTMVATQLTDNRRLLLEVQLQQDLRATADIIAREVRRAGSFTNKIAEAADGVWTEGSEPQRNTNLLDFSVTNGPASTVRFRSSRTQGSHGPYGFTLVDGAIRSYLSQNASQQLTDPATVKITNFSITEADEAPVKAMCAEPCSAGPVIVNPNTACWPTLKVRSLLIHIEGKSVSDETIRRSLTSRVRLRNDEVAFNADPLNPNKVCPDATP